MNEHLQAFIEETKFVIDEKLPQSIRALNAPASLKDAMIYSLEAGGKRIRPLLLLATLKGFDKSFETGYELACAIEMIHTYSLIHDDLPAMDDDDLRRGKPTNHKVFGEATAILAGDALLTHSFERIASSQLAPEKVVRLIKELAIAAGPVGMIGGQVADMEGEERALTLEELTYIHNHKTGDLLTYSIVAGAIIADASEEDVERLRHFARELGLLFQIKDDLLDVEGEQELIGKPLGSDVGNNKSTYPSLLGLNETKEVLNAHYDVALESLHKVSMNTNLLESLADYIKNRNH
ncbi:farnesyl-diphosphate synthase [Alkalihalobacillus alcalophilus ATCC 27647 = CGMCC 1.3604]|uniref:Farnesyl diphosphate synthase n=1 Tax=Alkalihalobacillus alcalophilus ATCC 27647 = CGMCC 1.3604 TaxID=1218173 RepID=A0A094YWJ7_ALKAL|nr:farnesyl diphosphate synthase [Alkalihalobacillus alcalophilus]KGA97897.1 farnesyl-diphosphate synthase [Alkalihalobacillus alcalophilus ATCC 27647 = CGMCC 1.3604]MED1561486.1 polyprenyl synthetase family protein [Alkalihalobacillus alcalophilus]THG88424.1 farnesyl-diphosphate synthase [Alkalihalobacillus alcalophilus ATCC 27647 = CGMCC 1.3604]